MTRALAAALHLALLPLLACGGDESGTAASQTAAGRVALLLGAPSPMPRGTLADALRTALDDRDQQVVIRTADGDVARQQQLVQASTAQGARAIVVVPLDTTALRAAVDAAAARRIPVFTVALPVRGARVTTHMEPDFHAAGVAAAEYMRAFLRGAFRAAVVGDVGAHGTRELDAGFRSRFAGDSARRVVGLGDSDGTREGAAAAVNRLLAGDAPLDAIFAMDPASALGAMDAAYAQRRADIVIVSFGATQPVLDAIGDTGPMRVAIVERVDEGARMLADAIVTQLAGEPVTASIKVPLRLVTK